MSEARDVMSCSSCEFFTGERRPGALGDCHLNPPTLTLIGEKAFWSNPEVHAGFFCGKHSDYRAYELKGMIRYGYQLYLEEKNRLEYSPGKFDDAAAAGFNRPPSIGEALKVAKTSAPGGDGGDDAVTEEPVRRSIEELAKEFEEWAAGRSQLNKSGEQSNGGTK